MNREAIGDRLRRIKIAANVIVIALVVIIIIQNTGSKEVKFLFWDFSLSLALMLFVTALFGFISGYLSARTRFRRKQKQREITHAQK